jgi:uncharacterized OB-fold protein
MTPPSEIKMRDIPGPQPDPETQPWWDACKNGQFLVRHCKTCGESHFLPRTICPFCFSDETEWKTAAGTGTIYTFSVMRRAGAPYVLAYVTLDEGPTVMTNIATADVDAVRIGQRVAVRFEDTDTGQKLPVFAPI